MITVSSPFVILNLGTSDVKYMWNGQELQGISKIFVYKGTRLTLHALDKSALPIEELTKYGIKVKEIK